ncbi:MAG TPA: hypothetical protein VM537_17760, partial [Anaerolineae bacterium]|nr:hypothetical protein [Anaerolineae bacterium]
YKEVYVPPKSVIIPWQEKGDTTYWTGTIGSSSGTSTVSGSTSTPGRTTWKTVQRPGRVEGAFYPTVAMLTADGAMARSQPENVAAALVSTEAIVQASKIGNGLLTGQMLLVRLLEQSSRLDRSLARQPFPGVIWGMLSSDGVDTYPTVVVIDEASPWAVAGLRRWDMILDVNSEDAANMLWPDFRSALGTETGKLKRLRVRRPDGEISIDLTLSGDTGLPRRPEASRGGD